MKKTKGGYLQTMNGKRSADADRKKLKNIKSPDPNKKKYRYYDPNRKMWMFADKKKILEQMKEDLKEEQSNTLASIYRY